MKFPIEQNPIYLAISSLISCCDGAHKKDGVGFNGRDAPFARSLYIQPEWSIKQEKAALKMLATYKNTQLPQLGIDYSALVKWHKDHITRSKEVGKELTNKGTKVTSVKLPLLDYHDKFFYLTSTYNFKEVAKSIPNHRWWAETKQWRYLPNVKVVNAFKDLVKSDEVELTLEAEKQFKKISRESRKEIKEQKEFSKRITLVQGIKQDNTPEVKVPLHAELFDHQKKAFAISTSLDNAALLMEMGTGKTLPAIATAGYRYLSKQIKKLLVIAPLSVVPVWPLEFSKFADFPYQVKTLEGKTKKRIESIKSWGDEEGLQVLVINYESTWRLEEELKKWHPDMIILDESQRIKNGKAKQTKSVIKLGKIAKYRLILTGTPVTQSPLDVFTQYKFLDDRIFGKNFFKFRDQYAIMGGYGGYQYLGPQNIEDLAGKAHSIAYRVTKKEALDLPEELTQNLYCQLDKSNPIYKEMDKEFVATIEEQTNIQKVVAPIVITKMLRLQQITGGFLPLEDGAITQVGSEKLDTFNDFLEDYPKGEKLVVFARFIPELRALKEICEKQGFTTGLLTGATKNRGELVNSFQEDPNPQVLLIQIQTGGLGITLTKASTAVFYSCDFSYANYEQAKARIHRIGQENKVTYLHLVAKGTIDETILEALESKRDVAELVVDKLKHQIPLS